MAKKEIESVTITKGKNGGHTIRHSFRRTPVKDSKAASGIGYDYPESEEHIFGPDDDHKVLTHIAQALQMRKIAKEEAAEDARGKGKEESD